VNFNATVRSIEEGVSVTVFFDEGISDDEISEIGQKIETRSEVGDCEFVSAQEAWEDYKKVYFEGREELAEGFTENPLANSAHFQVYLNDVSKQDSLVTYLEAQDGVREVKQSAQVANTLTDFNRLISYVSAGIILILLCVAVFLISNTVVVGISVRREEIAIMKLIGATDYLVRAPFVVEGIVIGLIGAAIPLALLYFLYQRIMVYIADQFNFIGSLIEFIPVNTVFRTLIPIAVLLGVGIGFLGSRMSVRKHLKV
jgi:cell division transport system permease protein